MRNDRNKAFELRKSGKSYSEISKELKVPRSTLSDWLGGEEWSQKIRKELDFLANNKNKVRIQRLNAVRGENLKRLYKEAEEEALEDFEKLKYHPLFIAGLMLYWGEGDRADSHRISLTNTDPAMIRLFLSFLQDICTADKARIKVWLLLYPDLNENLCKDYWIKNAGIEGILFNKSIVIQGRHKTKRLGNGVCTVVFVSRYLKTKVLKWLALLPEVLLKEEYYKKAGMV